MAKYIDKAAVVAEIERKMNLCKQILLRSRTRQDDDYHQGNIEAYEVVISLLDTLEVKEVGEEPTSNDLEEAVKKYLTSLRKSHFEGYDIERAFKKGAQWQKEQMVNGVDLEKELIIWHRLHFKKEGTFEKYGGFYLANSSQLDLAKHFFELGRKADELPQKPEQG